MSQQRRVRSVPVCGWLVSRVRGIGCLLALSLSVLAGCGEKTGTLPISGKVSYQGKPVVGARVSFVSKAGTRPADGVTDSEGRYQLGTFMAGDGALPGDYGVVVSSAGPDATKPPSTEIQGADAYAVPTAESRKSTLPAKYLTPEKSGLKAVVEASGPKSFDFDLKD